MKTIVAAVVVALMAGGFAVNTADARHCVPGPENPRDSRRDQQRAVREWERDQRIEEQERRLGDLERQQQIERSNRFYREDAFGRQLRGR